jgi:AcrR family transcriptional regulator
METFFVNLKINPSLYVKDPLQTDLGKKIIESSVDLIDEIGLEPFTFKKLAHEIGSTEASIYRYFENKHQLFVYLLNWFWEWMSIRIDLNTLNMSDPGEKLQRALHVIVDTANVNSSIEFVNESKLHKIVVSEGAKGYHHKLVDEENEEGFFLAYKKLCNKIAEILEEINPHYPYPKSLANLLIETSNNNLYYARHLPRLSDLDGDSPKLTDQVESLLNHIAFNLLRSENSPKTRNQKRTLVSNGKH